MKYILGAIAAAAILAVVFFVWRGDPVMENSTSLQDIIDMVRNDKDIILVDVRTPQEYREKRIPGSILLPDYEVKTKAAEVFPDKDAKIVVYCRSGRRSAESAKILRELGYKNVYDLGGINNWPYETTSGE